MNHLLELCEVGEEMKVTTLKSHLGVINISRSGFPEKENLPHIDGFMGLLNMAR